MKYLITLFVIVCFPLFLRAQNNGDLENTFYIRFGLSSPTKAYLGWSEEAWSNYSRGGGTLEFGQIFMINRLDLGEGLRLGVNVDYADLTYHQLSSKINDSARGVFKLSSKVGPSLSYSPVPKLVFDGYAKFKMTWVAGMAFADSNGNVGDDGYAGTLGSGYAVGINVRYKFMMLCFEYNNDKITFEDASTDNYYYGNYFGVSGNSPLSSMNITFGFNF